MSKRDMYEKKAEELVTKIVEENHFELVDVEYVKEASNWYLRIYIDKEGGITVDDCEIVSRALENLLDTHDFIEDAYILEVSSPGLGRQLKKEKDFQRNIGKEVEIKLYKPQNGKKEYVGILTEYDSDNITIEETELTETKKITISRKEIAIIRLTFDF